ncbi:unnamed protein product, partial [Prorocentrum cordatum]
MGGPPEGAIDAAAIADAMIEVPPVDATVEVPPAQGGRGRPRRRTVNTVLADVMTHHGGILAPPESGAQQFDSQVDPVDGGPEDSIGGAALANTNPFVVSDAESLMEHVYDTCIAGGAVGLAFTEAVRSDETQLPARGATGSNDEGNIYNDLPDDADERATLVNAEWNYGMLFAKRGSGGQPSSYVSFSFSLCAPVQAVSDTTGECYYAVLHQTRLADADRVAQKFAHHQRSTTTGGDRAFIRAERHRSCVYPDMQLLHKLRCVHRASNCKKDLFKKKVPREIEFCTNLALLMRRAYNSNAFRREWNGCEEIVEYFVLLQGLGICADAWGKWIAVYYPSEKKGAQPRVDLDGKGALQAVLDSNPAGTSVPHLTVAAQEELKQLEQKSHRGTVTKHSATIGPDEVLSTAVVVLRTMNLHRDCIGGLIYSCGDHKNLKQIASSSQALKGNHGRTFMHQVLEAYDVELETRLVDNAFVLMPDSAHWGSIPLRCRTLRLQCTAFRLLSQAVCTTSLIKLEKTWYPDKAFAGIRSDDAMKAALDEKDCLLDSWSLQFCRHHRRGVIEDARHDLMHVASLLHEDTVKQEWRKLRAADVFFSRECGQEGNAQPSFSGMWAKFRRLGDGDIDELQRQADEANAEASEGRRPFPKGRREMQRDRARADAEAVAAMHVRAQLADDRVGQPAPPHRALEAHGRTLAAVAAASGALAARPSADALAVIKRALRTSSDSGRREEKVAEQQVVDFAERGGRAGARELALAAGRAVPHAAGASLFVAGQRNAQSEEGAPNFLHAEWADDSIYQRAQRFAALTGQTRPARALRGLLHRFWHGLSRATLHKDCEVFDEPPVHRRCWEARRCICCPGSASLVKLKANLEKTTRRLYRPGALRSNVDSGFIVCCFIGSAVRHDGDGGPAAGCDDGALYAFMHVGFHSWSTFEPFYAPMRTPGYVVDLDGDQKLRERLVELEALPRSLDAWDACEIFDLSKRWLLAHFELIDNDTVLGA